MNGINNIKEIYKMDESLSDYARIVEKALASWPQREQRHLQLLSALIELTRAYPDKADEGFITLELHEAVSQQLNKPWGSTDIAPKTVSTAWAKLETMWPTKTEGLKQRAQEAGLRGYPVLKKHQGGGGGHSSRYCLAIEPLADVIGRSEETPKSLPKSDRPVQVHYYLDEQERLRGPAKWLADGFVLEGWRRTVFVTMILVSVLLLYALLMLMLFALPQSISTGKTIQLLFFGGVILYFAWRALGPFYQVMEYKTVIAPSWLQPFTNEDNRLLIFETRRPKAANRLQLARYVGDCPLCAGTVELRRGGWVFPGRIIGRCQNSPREHVYQFDHIFRSGTLI
jgi:hypothetical protein